MFFPGEPKASLLMSTLTPLYIFYTALVDIFTIDCLNDRYP